MPYRNEAPQTVQYRGRARHYRSSLFVDWAVAEPAGNPDSGAADSNCFLRSAGVRFLLMVCLCGGYRLNHRAVSRNQARTSENFRP